MQAWYVCPHFKRFGPTNVFPLFDVLLDATFKRRLVLCRWIEFTQREVAGNHCKWMQSVIREESPTMFVIDWCCFDYFVRNSLVALLQALFKLMVLLPVSVQIRVLSSFCHLDFAYISCNFCPALHSTHVHTHTYYEWHTCKQIYMHACLYSTIHAYEYLNIYIYLGCIHISHILDIYITWYARKR